jgi:hypothetical protein
MIDELKAVLRAILDDATGTHYCNLQGDRTTWPIRAENYLRAMALLEEDLQIGNKEAMYGVPPIPDPRSAIGTTGPRTAEWSEPDAVNPDKTAEAFARWCANHPGPPLPLDRNRLAADILTSLIQSGYGISVKPRNAVLIADELLAELVKEPKA